MRLHWLCVLATTLLAIGTQPDVLDDGDGNEIEEKPAEKPTPTMKKVVIQKQTTPVESTKNHTDKKRTLYRAHQVQWEVSRSGESCTAACTRHVGYVCNQATMSGIQGENAIKALASTLGKTCSPNYGIIAGSFPAIISSQQCEDASINGGDTCGQTTVPSLERFCACTPPGGHDDPHLTNIHGQHFDALREGINTLLQFPRPRTSGGPQENVLRVDASIEHPGNGSRCSGFYFLKLWVQGSLVGENNIEITSGGWDLLATDALAIKVGNTIMRNDSEVASFVTNGKYNMTLTDERSIMNTKNVNNRYKYASLLIHLAGIDLKIDWNTGMRRPNSLDFSAKSLKLFGGDWGGILGSDDHSWVASFDPQCRKSKDYDKLAQLVQIEEDEEVDAQRSWARASLD